MVHHGFVTEFFLEDEFRRLVGRLDCLHQIVDAEVSNSNLLLVKEYIFRTEALKNYFVLSHVHEEMHDLNHNLTNDSLRNGPPQMIADKLFERSLIAILHDDHEIGRYLKYFLYLAHKWHLALLHGLNLTQG